MGTPLEQVIVTAAGSSRKGPERSQNEDAWRIYADQPMVRRVHRGTLYAVADGVGGTGAGRYASWHVVDRLAFFFQVPTSEFDPGRTVQRILADAHRTLRELAAQDRAYTMAQTTLALVYVAPSGLRGYALGIGDSGIFFLHRGRMRQVNEDHRDERGKVTSSLGMDGDLRVSVRPLRFQEGDVLLLCTDGVREELSEPELAHLLSLPAHPADVAERITAEAEMRGGRDNMTAVVIRFGPCPPRSTTASDASKGLDA